MSRGLGDVYKRQGLDLEGTPVPAAGEEVKPAGEAPTDEWLLSLFNFDVEGVEILE